MMFLGYVFSRNSKIGKPSSITGQIAFAHSTSSIWKTSASTFSLLLQGSNRNERIWVTHFIQLSVIVGWLSGMFIHVARFSNYSCWLSDPIHIHPSTLQQPILYQESLNINHGIQITSGFFHSSIGIDSEYQLYTISIS